MSGVSDLADELQVAYQQIADLREHIAKMVLLHKLQVQKLEADKLALLQSNLQKSIDPIRERAQAVITAYDQRSGGAINFTMALEMLREALK